MEKTILVPGMWGEVGSDEVNELQMSYGVVTHRPGYKKVVFSGDGSTKDDIKQQTQDILTRKQDAINNLGGTMDDITTLRICGREELLSPETQIQIHEARSEFFERPHYPAATMIGVAALIHEEVLIEIEIEAEIPNDSWETEVVTGDE